jgi:hypothetical protein
MRPAESYRDLIVGQKSMDLAKHIYDFTRNFPRDEVYELRAQIRRAAVSVSANIAEVKPEAPRKTSADLYALPGDRSRSWKRNCSWPRALAMATARPSASC